jgi:hypothetical protein
MGRLELDNHGHLRINPDQAPLKQVSKVPCTSSRLAGRRAMPACLAPLVPVPTRTGLRASWTEWVFACQRGAAGWRLMRHMGFVCFSRFPRQGNSVAHCLPTPARACAPMRRCLRVAATNNVNRPRHLRSYQQSWGRVGFSPSNMPTQQDVWAQTNLVRPGSIQSINRPGHVCSYWVRGPPWLHVWRICVAASSVASCACRIRRGGGFHARIRMLGMGGK